MKSSVQDHSAVLHYRHCLLAAGNQESPDRTVPQSAANGRTGLLPPKLELIGEDEMMDTYDLYDPYGDDLSDHGDMDMDFLEVELVRSMFRPTTKCQ